MRKWILALVVSLPLASGMAGTNVAYDALLNTTTETSGDDFGMPVKEEETIRQQYPLAAGDRLFDLDNVWGSITVTGADIDQVQLVVKKTIRAETKEDMDRAKREVTLETKNEGAVVRLYVNGPFRCQNRDGDGCCCNWHGHDGYVVVMDFEVQVPRRIRLALRTVNEGNISVRGVAGDFSIRNVNGRIEVQDAAGSGQVKTVNGAVKVTFRTNPTAKSEFSTVNGPIDLYFMQPLAADFRFKTFNGGVYSDYELTQMPSVTPEPEKNNGRFVFRADRFTHGRVGAGGPEISIDTLNGDIRVLQRHASI